MAINELRSISLFAKAVELGSIRQAAMAQDISPQAAAQAIAQLEKKLGVRLLHRTTRSLALTEEGQRFLENTLPAVATLERAMSTARDAKDEIAGPLRIVGPKSSFPSLLMPVLDEFCREYPGIQPDVQLDDGIGNWVVDRVDVGFRMGESLQEGLISRSLFPIQLIVCASPAYLEHHGLPNKIEDLTRHRCSVFRHPTTGKVAPWYLTVNGEVERVHMAPALSTNGTELEMQAVLAGQVVGQVANFSAASHIRSGRLVPLLQDHVSDHIALHVYYGSRASQPKRVRAFVDLALARLLDNPSYVITAKELQAAARPRSRRRAR
jgi:DNA-binding transcriptional LysR family regulator